MREGITGTLAIDASVLIDLLMLSNRGKIFQKALLDEVVDAHTTEIAIIETKYILCRRLGWNKANTQVEKLLASGYISVEKTEQIIDLAARYKCERNISLADSLILALAKKLGCKALFSHREEELIGEIQKKKLDVEIIFLEDYAK